MSDDGEKLFPRDWNHEFIDLPAVSKQAQPCARTEDVERAIKNVTSHQEQLLYAVLSGAGLRIAEALSIHVCGAEDQTSCDAATAAITVCSSIYNGAEQHRRFHSFRRHRVTRLRDLAHPRISSASGWATRGRTSPIGIPSWPRMSSFVRNGRAALDSDLNWTKWGTQRPNFLCIPQPQNLAPVKTPRPISWKHSLARRKPVLSVPDIVEAPTSSAYVATDDDLHPFFATPVPVHEEV